MTEHPPPSPPQKLCTSAAPQLEILARNSSSKFHIPGEETASISCFVWTELKVGRQEAKAPRKRFGRGRTRRRRNGCTHQAPRSLARTHARRGRREGGMEGWALLPPQPSVGSWLSRPAAACVVETASPACLPHSPAALLPFLHPSPRMSICVYLP